MKMSELIEHANSIILRMDTEGRVTFFNTFARKFFGYRASEILGKNVVGTIVPVADSSGRDLKAMIADIMRRPNNYISNENENTLRDGSRVWIAWTNKFIAGRRGAKSEILCIGNDITKIKEAERQLKEMDARKSAFVANVSHEFKNPLNNAKAAILVMLDGVAGEINADQKLALEAMKRNVERLVRLVNDLLDISKIEAGKMKLKAEEVDMPALIGEVIDGNKTDITKKRLTVKSDIQSGIGAITADKDKMTEVVINLLTNAIKYTPDGGSITIRLRRPPEGMRFEIADTGPGIAKENIRKLFDKFERITAEKQEGTGLGLCIAKDIVELHKGKIWVESEPGKGSTFIFTLPSTCRRGRSG